MSLRVSPTPDFITALSTEEAEHVLVLVDPMSTSAALAYKASRRNIATVVVWSEECPAWLQQFVAGGIAVDFADEIHDYGDVEATIARIEACGVVADVIVESESGSVLADQLAEALIGRRGNVLAQSSTARFDRLKHALGLSRLRPTCNRVDAFIQEHATLFTNANVKPGEEKSTRDGRIMGRTQSDPTFTTFQAKLEEDLSYVQAVADFDLAVPVEAAVHRGNAFVNYAADPSVWASARSQKQPVTSQSAVPPLLQMMQNFLAGFCILMSTPERVAALEEQHVDRSARIMRSKVQSESLRDLDVIGETSEWCSACMNEYTHA